eukprot:g2060.t1
MGADVLRGSIVVWDEKEKEFCQRDDVDMWVDGDRVHEPGEAQYAPQQLHFKSPCVDVSGGYEIVPKTCCERPIYYSEETGLNLIYTGGRWVATASQTVKDGFTFKAESLKTDRIFPTECVWTEGNVVEEVLPDDMDVWSAVPYPSKQAVSAPAPSAADAGAGVDASVGANAEDSADTAPKDEDAAAGGGDEATADDPAEAQKEPAGEAAADAKAAAQPEPTTSETGPGAEQEPQVQEVQPQAEGAAESPAALLADSPPTSVASPPTAVVTSFVDSAFPPTATSVSASPADVPPELVWYRGHELSYSTRPQLFERSEPSDLLNGCVSRDAGALAALALVAEFPGYVEAALMAQNKNKNLSPDGKYFVELYDVGEGAWISVEVDDWIPCLGPKNWYERRPKPLCGQPRGNELYALLVEKAFAKFCGSYANLCGAAVPSLLTALTGNETQEIWDIGKGVTKNVASIEMRRKNPRDLQRLFTQKTEEVQYDDFFQYLRAADKNNFVVACAIAPRRGKEARIIPGVGSLAGEKHRLLKLRNVHGAASLWNGKFAASDESSWKSVQHPHMHQKRDEETSTFWIEYLDFLSIFTTVYVSPQDMGVARASHNRTSSLGSEQFEMILGSISKSATQEFARVAGGTANATGMGEHTLPTLLVEPEEAAVGEQEARAKA